MWKLGTKGDWYRTRRGPRLCLCSCFQDSHISEKIGNYSSPKWTLRHFCDPITRSMKLAECKCPSITFLPQRHSASTSWAQHSKWSHFVFRVRHFLHYILFIFPGNYSVILHHSFRGNWDTDTPRPRLFLWPWMSTREKPTFTLP